MEGSDPNCTQWKPPPALQLSPAPPTRVPLLGDGSSPAAAARSWLPPAPGSGVPPPAEPPAAGRWAPRSAAGSYSACSPPSFAPASAHGEPGRVRRVSPLQHPQQGPLGARPHLVGEGFSVLAQVLLQLQLLHGLAVVLGDQLGHCGDSGGLGVWQVWRGAGHPRGIGTATSLGCVHPRPSDPAAAPSAAPLTLASPDGVALVAVWWHWWQRDRDGA